MIHSIHIHNFKVFKDVNIELAPLTILTGLNGRGKSSMIQALLLAWDTMHSSNPSFELNNRLVGLGTAAEVFSWFHDDNIIAIGINGSNYSNLFKSEILRPYMANDDSISLDLTENNRFPYETGNDNLLYLSTWRMRDLHHFPTASQQRMFLSNPLSELYGDGMLTPIFLELFGKNNIKIPALAADSTTDMTLVGQANAWLKVISPDLNFDVKSSDKGMRLRYSQVGTKGVSTLSAEAYNVGFGISYALPVITSILASKPGDIVIIETPEAHIHPAGQAKLMNLIARAAACGVQVILETHSDHVIHGVLRNLKSSVLRENNVCMLFFDQLNKDTGAVIRVLQCTSHGRIRGACPGFFDQYMSDMDELL